jgi:hypothetical protein
MIHNLDDTLKELLVQKVPLDPNAIDIKFEVPNKDDWNPKPNKPTINCGSSVCVMQWTGVIRDGTLI